MRDLAYRDAHPHPEDIFLVIEFSNNSLEKDTEEKRLVYAQANLAEYWVINLKDRGVILYRNPLQGDYQFRQKVYSGDISPLAFPDVVININQLLD